jgi:hypothetical protein
MIFRLYFRKIFFLLYRVNFVAENFMKSKKNLLNLTNKKFHGNLTVI